MSQKIGVEGVDAFMIYADDPQKVARWYERHLGIGTRLEADGNRYGEVADREAGKAIHVGIYPGIEGHASRRRAVMMNFRVADLSAFVERLRSEGVEVEQEIDEGWGKFAYFTDPEGHPIEIWQKVSAPPGVEEGESQ